MRGGRVIDPESRFDAVADVAIGEGRVAEIGTGLPRAGRGERRGTCGDAGFVDLHSHVDDLAGLRLQVLDGVTTALELEAGASPVAAAYRTVVAEGRPINYGFAAVLGAGPDDRGRRVRAGRHGGPVPGPPRSPRLAAPRRPAQLAALLSRLAGDLADGALGIGLLLGYAPPSTRRSTCGWRNWRRRRACRPSRTPGT